MLDTQIKKRVVAKRAADAIEGAVETKRLKIKFPVQEPVNGGDPQFHERAKLVLQRLGVTSVRDGQAQSTHCVRNSAILVSEPGCEAQRLVTTAVVSWMWMLTRNDARRYRYNAVYVPVQ